MTKTTKKTTATTREHIGFGVHDAKGREIGCIVIRNTVTYEPRPEGQTWGYTVPAGDYVEVTVQAARNGSAYGASQRSRKQWAVAQADGAEPFIAKRIADSRKAALKKAAAL